MRLSTFFLMLAEGEGQRASYGLAAQGLRSDAMQTAGELTGHRFADNRVWQRKQARRLLRVGLRFGARHCL